MFTRLAELPVHGANVEEGQIVLVAAEIGLEELAPPQVSRLEA